MTSYQTIFVGSLLGVAVALCALCALGLATAKDAYQRLQFCTPLTSLAMPLIAIAIWIGDPDWQSRIKSTLIAVFLLVMNGVISHATARAVRIRDIGHWPLADDERIKRGNE